MTSNDPTRPARSILSMAVRDGEIRLSIRGLPRRMGADVFHRLMRLGWGRLLALFAGFFLVFNLLFAGLYTLDPGGIVVTREEMTVPAFWRAFFFSVHTVATIGYGNMYPSDVFTNTVVVVEITLGIVYFALTTGMAFARFSRPTARLLFSQAMVVREIDGVPHLMLRAANQRHNMLYSAEARVSVLADAEVGGIRLRRFVDLALVRSSNPAFALTWLIMHAIDADSPLAGWLGEGGPPPDAELIVILSGTDEISGQVVHGRWAYGAEHIHWGGRFADIVGVEPDGTRSIDYARFHEVISD